MIQNLIDQLRDKLRVHHTRNDIYESGVGGILPFPYRFTIKDTLSMRRGLNLRRAAPKQIQPLTYTSPTTNPNSHVTKNHNSYVNKDELLNSFPSNTIPDNSLPLTGLLQQSLTSQPLPVEYCTCKDNIMAFFFRFIPEHTRFKQYQFTFRKEEYNMLMHVFTSLGLSKMVRFSAPSLFYNTRIRGGFHNLLEGIATTSTSTINRTPCKRLIEFVTYYQGKYGRLIILVSLGVGCTVWYNFLPGLPEAPPPILVPRELPYICFQSVGFNLAPFQKMGFVENKYITDIVLSAFENVYPFTEINLPSINTSSINSYCINDGSNARVSFGLGIIVAVFLGMGMMSYSDLPVLELRKTCNGEELIVKR